MSVAVEDLSNGPKKSPRETNRPEPVTVNRINMPFQNSGGGSQVAES